MTVLDFRFKLGRYETSPVFVTIALQQSEQLRLRLSIMGEVNPRGPWGQCVETVRQTRPLRPFTQEDVDTVCDIWERWHLNDMRAGCMHQRALGWKVCPGHYDPARKATCSAPNYEEQDTLSLADVQDLKDSLLKDGVALVGKSRYYICAEDKVWQPCPVCGYKFGTHWLHEQLPVEVLVKIWEIYQKAASVPCMSFPEYLAIVDLAS